VLDVAGCELACASSVLVVAIDKDGNCCGIRKMLGGTLAELDIAASLVVSYYCKFYVALFYTVLLLLLLAMACVYVHSCTLSLSRHSVSRSCLPFLMFLSLSFLSVCLPSYSICTAVPVLMLY
jgi:hypothetical protein